MINDIVQNSDLFYYVLSFLTNDGTSVTRFALSSKELYNRILQSQTIGSNLWKELVFHRWKRTRRRPLIRRSSSDDDNNIDDNETSNITPLSISYRELYIEKRRADADAIRQLKQMAPDLQENLQLHKTKICYKTNMALRDHHCWHFLLRNRSDFMDILKATARQHLNVTSASSATKETGPSSIHDRLVAFLAASSFQFFHFVDCIWEWKRLIENSGEEQQLGSRKSLQLEAAHLLERCCLLVCEIQKTPLELLKEESLDAQTNNCDDYNNFNTNYTSTNHIRATSFLEEIAGVCREQIHEQLEENANVTAQIKVVNEVLVNHYGFSGNSIDYYNYRNVLLDHVLESKTGMPLTLCVVYSCICRRLGIAVELIGLPGHVVLGFDTEDESNSVRGIRSFIDVFHGGRILSTDDCRQITASNRIEWHDDFLTPLSTDMTMQRIFNNLQNCHEKAMGNLNPPFFCSDLMSHQNSLGYMHRNLRGVPHTALERYIQDHLPIVLSSDLLRFFHLFSP